jgi:hypothetical protein
MVFLLTSEHTIMPLSGTFVNNRRSISLVTFNKKIHQILWSERTGEISSFKIIRLCLNFSTCEIWVSQSGVLEHSSLKWRHAQTDFWRIFTARHGEISQNTWTLLDAFSQIREIKLLVSSNLFVCPSIRMMQLGSRWTDFHEIWYLNINRKSVDKIQASLKSDKNNGHFTWRPMYIYDSIFMNSS